MPIELMRKHDDQYRTVPVAYYGGPQYPRLERIRGTPDYLDEIVKAKQLASEPDKKNRVCGFRSWRAWRRHARNPAAAQHRAILRDRQE